MVEKKTEKKPKLSFGAKQAGIVNKAADALNPLNERIKRLPNPPAEPDRYNAIKAEALKMLKGMRQLAVMLEDLPENVGIAGQSEFVVGMKVEIKPDARKNFAELAESEMVDLEVIAVRPRQLTLKTLAGSKIFMPRKLVVAK